MPAPRPHPRCWYGHERSGARLLGQVVPICIPELEAVRVAQILTIAAELAQAYKWALAKPGLRRQLNADTRISLAAAMRFSATDFLQVRAGKRELELIIVPLQDSWDTVLQHSCAAL